MGATAASRAKLLMVRPWPSSPPAAMTPRAAEMHWVIDLIYGIRSVRAEMNVPAAAKMPLVLTDASGNSAARLAKHIDVIA